MVPVELPHGGEKPASELLREATARLASAQSASAQSVSARLASPGADARLLLAHVLDCEPGRLPIARVSDAEATSFDALIERRAAGVPVQHVTGVAYFRRIRVRVGPGVFIPRPETEVMTGWAIERLRELLGTGRRPVVVELCAGSGAISLAVADEVPGCEQYAVELSTEATAYAEQNLAGTGVRLVEGDMAEALHSLDGRCDVVIANPPYIPLDAYEQVAEEVRKHDPPEALFSGADGLDATRVVAGVAARLLRPGGWVCSEHAEVQRDGAPEVFVRNGHWAQVRDHHDLTRRPRFVTGQRR